MSFEARLIALRHLRGEISAARTRLAGDPVDPLRADQRTHEVNKLIARAARWEQSLDLFKREIKSQVHGAAARFEGLRPGPGGRGPGPARDRFRNQMQKADRLDAAVTSVTAELAAFNAELWSGPPAQKKALDALAEVLKSAAETREAGGEHHAAHEQQLTSAVQQLADVLPVQQRPSGFGIDSLFILALALAALLKRHAR